MDKIEVSQRAREKAFDAYMTCFETVPNDLWLQALLDGKHDGDEMAQAFARFERDILATRTDATPVAWMYYAEDGQEATQPLKNRLVPNTMGWTEAPLFSHPPATDVAALVEAAKKIMPIRVNDGPDYAEVYFADGEKHSTHAMTMNPQDWLDLSAALAPFTKGQNDDAVR